MEADKKIEEGEDPAVLAILVTSTATLVVASVYWILLLRSTSCQLLVLPHLLLLSIFLGSTSSLALVLIESSPTCLVFVLQPLSYSLVYSSILLRLISLHLHQRKLPASSLHPAFKREDRLGKEPFAGFGTVVEDITESGYTKNQPILLGPF